jgi:hypothetical protein
MNGVAVGREGDTGRDCPILQCEPLDDFEAATMTAVNLRRVDPARNMRRFYRLDITRPR